jgi:hypothetical protein
VLDDSGNDTGTAAGTQQRAESHTAAQENNPRLD